MAKRGWGVGMENWNAAARGSDGYATPKAERDAMHLATPQPDVCRYQARIREALNPNDLGDAYVRKDLGPRRVSFQVGAAAGECRLLQRGGKQDEQLQPAPSVRALPVWAFTRRGRRRAGWLGSCVLRGGGRHELVVETGGDAGSVLKVATSCWSAVKVTGAALNSKVPAPTL